MMPTALGWPPISACKQGCGCTAIAHNVRIEPLASCLYFALSYEYIS